MTQMLQQIHKYLSQKLSLLLDAFQITSFFQSFSCRVYLFSSAFMKYPFQKFFLLFLFFILFSYIFLSVCLYLSTFFLYFLCLSFSLCHSHSLYRLSSILSPHFLSLYLKLSFPSLFKLQLFFHVRSRLVNPYFFMRIFQWFYDFS